MVEIKGVTICSALIVKIKGVTTWSSLIVEIKGVTTWSALIVEIKRGTTWSALIVEIKEVTTLSALIVKILNDHMECTRCLSFKIRDFSFIIYNPEVEAQRSFAQAALNYKTEKKHARDPFLCLRVIVNEKT